MVNTEEESWAEERWKMALEHFSPFLDGRPKRVVREEPEGDSVWVRMKSEQEYTDFLKDAR